MKILILHSGNDNSDLIPVYNLLKRYQIEAFVFALNNEWKPDKAEKINIYLNECSHFIMSSVNHPDLNSPWGAFFLGYIKGRELPGYFLLNSGDENIRKTVFLYNNGESLESLEQYLRIEIEKFDKKKQKEDALLKLTSEGIKPSDEQFIAYVESGDIEKCEFFLKAGFSSNIINSRKVPLLNLAARKGQVEIVELLLKNKANAHAISGDRQNTALMDAATEGHVEMVQILIEAGTDLNVKNTSNQTALILAAGQGKKDVASLLIKAGADTRQKDLLGMSARKYAQLFHFDDLLELLDSQDNQP